MRTRKKLIEVALPLDAVNKASAREKSIRHGHPSTLHLWWARRPLAAARAVIFAQMVDDPNEYVDVLLSDPKMRRAAKRRLRQRQVEFESRPAAAEEGGRGLGADAGGGGGRAGARAPVQAHRRTRAVGEHHQRRGAEAGADRDLAELAAHLRRERRAPARQGAVRPPQAARVPRPVCRRRRPAAGGATPRPPSPCQRPQPGGGAHQQGDDRDPAEVRRPPAGEPAGAQRCHAGRQDLARHPGPSRRRPLLRQVDARRGREADRASVPQGRGYEGDGAETPGSQALRRT